MPRTPLALLTALVAAVAVPALAAPAHADPAGRQIPECYLITLDTPKYHPSVDVCRPHP